MKIWLLFAFILVVLLDLPQLLRTNQKKKTTVVYSSLIGIGFIISWLQLMDNVPTSPAVIIEKMIRYVLEGLS